MANIKPFKALRPAADKAKQVSCVPYDVVYESEVRAFIESNPLSFLRVTRAEAEFPADRKTPIEDVFQRARQNLDMFIGDEIYSADPNKAFYVYRLTSGLHTQTGVVGVCAIDDYERSVIKKHENVRPDKVEDRTGHLLAVEAQTGLIFLAFRNTGDIADLIEEAIEGEPLYHFVCADGVYHTIWQMKETASWTEAFTHVPALYIADGHHRAESAKLARDKMIAANPEHTGEEKYNYVVAGMFPAEDLNILPYNRVIKDLNGLTKEDLFDKIRENFILATDTSDKVPNNAGEFCMYFDGMWSKLRFNVQFVRQPDPIEALDVSILQDYLLGPVLGIDDPRTNERIGFVGGKRGTAELERLVDEGNAKIAFSLYPPTMDEMLAVSDMGEVMPPKSTWFEPKLRDGILVYQI